MKKAHEDAFSSTSQPENSPLESQNEQEDDCLEELLETTAPMDSIALDARESLYSDLLQSFNEHFQGKK